MAERFMVTITHLVTGSNPVIDYNYIITKPLDTNVRKYIFQQHFYNIIINKKNRMGLALPYSWGWIATRS